MFFSPPPPLLSPSLRMASTGAAFKPLSEDEASTEMRKMVAFIMQEAGEKAREITVKADEEFNIEKAKLVRQEGAAIEAQYGKRLKQAELRRKIAQSAQVNRARLRILEARDRVLDEVVEGTRGRLCELSRDASPGSPYEALTVALLAQVCLCARPPALPPSAAL